MELVKNNSMYIVPLLLYTLLYYLLNYLFSPMMCFDSFESHSYVPYAIQLNSFCYLLILLSILKNELRYNPSTMQNQSSSLELTGNN